MKNYITIIILFFICDCATRPVGLSYYLSTLENIQDFPPTEKESKIIDSLNQKSKEFSEKCERENLNCFECPVSNNAEFIGGANKFREVLSENKNSRFQKINPSENSEGFYYLFY
jgi:hypothetical protein